jgi:Ca-activated chloride channel family protein
MKKITKFSIVLWTLLFSVLSVAAINITGKVADKSGVGIPKVSITVKETGQTTATDRKGSFSIEADAKHHLVFSHHAYKEQNIAINGRTFLSVILLSTELVGKDSIVALSECVVVGYGTQRKVAVTGACAGVSIRGARSLNFTENKNMANSMPATNWNTENYSAIHENGYKNAFDQPLSTFSVDVDNAAYSNVRRILNMGQLPPVDAVRIEEMINYFNYEYERPTKDAPYSINSELTVCPWNENHQLLLVGLRAKEIDKSNLPASNLVFLIDVSGSMQEENKLPLVQSAMRILVNELRPNDRVAIVVYAGAAGIVLESTPGSQKETILNAINGLSAGGSTAGGEGIKLAYKTAREHFIKGGNNRIILATDGDFNVGVSSTSEMERLVEQERESGTFITVLGFGMGNIKDDKMEAIADKGNGNYAYIDNIQEARRMFIKEFGGTLFTVAKDVKFQLEFNPQNVKAYRLIGYENRLLNAEDFKDDKKDAGEMGVGHRVTALYEIVPAGSDEKLPAIDELKYQKRKNESMMKFSDELVTVKTRYKTPDGTQSYPINQVVTTKATKFSDASENIRFASAVAGFGMLLRNSEFAGNINYSKIAEIAKKAKGNDDEGYRGEFVRLVKVAESLAQSRAEK